jgi:hypothetical protein
MDRLELLKIENMLRAFAVGEEQRVNRYLDPLEIQTLLDGGSEDQSRPCGVVPSGLTPR